MADSIEELYETYKILTEAKETVVSKHSQEYLKCVERTKGNEKEKKLAAQIVSKFFKHFPDLQEKALNAIFDLCEDDDSMIRIRAMQVLPAICKDSKEYVPKVTYILAQLLKLDESDDNTPTNTLSQIYKEDPVCTLKTVFNHVSSTDDATEREKCLQFIYKKIIKMEEKLTSEIYDLLLEEGKKIIPESDGTEFGLVMPYLTASKLTKTIAGQQELVNLVDEKAEIDGSFDPLEENGQNVNRVMMCVDFALPLFNANVESTKFTKFYCDQILPNYYAIGTLKEGSTLQYHALKQLAELSTHCGKLENPSLHVVQIFDKLKHFMPLPPEDADLEKMPNLDLTSVECLLYAFHRLARQCPDFLTADPAVLKDFRARLTYFSIGVCGCKRSLEKHSGKKLNEDQQKIAPALFENISSLINDLYYTVPIYECKIQLSFKSLTKKIQLSPEKSSVPQKRHTPIHFESSNGSAPKNARPSKGEGIKLYAPPSGKFSNNFQSYGETTLHAIHSCVTQEARETHCSPASSQEGFETTGSSSYIAD